LRRKDALAPDPPEEGAGALDDGEADGVLLGDRVGDWLGDWLDDWLGDLDGDVEGDGEGDDDGVRDGACDRGVEDEVFPAADGPLPLSRREAANAIPPMITSSAATARRAYQRPRRRGRSSSPGGGTGRTSCGARLAVTRESSSSPTEGATAPATGTGGGVRAKATVFSRVRSEACSRASRCRLWAASAIDQRD
jgi:hypothetical protein